MKPGTLPGEDPPGAAPTRIAIIGGGFSGVMTATQLARRSRQPLRVTLINHGRPAGRGIAYGMRRPEHLLNVAARNMSAFPDQPDHFLQWLRTRGEFDAVPEGELRERFIPRPIYGDYLRSIMLHDLQCAGAMTPVATTCVDGEATEVEWAGGAAVVHLADGARVAADRVVLALGNETPAPLPGAGSLAAHPGWVGYPWGGWESRLPAAAASLVILGTGLTSVDIVLTLRRLGWPGRVDAVSRNGWLPESHFRGIEYPDFPPAGVDLATLGLERLRALVEEHCARLRARQQHPAIIVDKLRPHTPRIWAGFTGAERRTFARRDAARWNVLRHRIAPEVHAQIADAQAAGQLRVHAGGVARLEAEGTRIRVILSGGGMLVGDLVINATGPATALTASPSPLVQNLLRRGLIAPDEADMGVRVDPDHAAVLASGERSPFLLALGPLLRGTLWETIAVPELRGQARRVAETLLDYPAAVAAVPDPAIMMEYMI